MAPITWFTAAWMFWQEKLFSANVTKSCSYLIVINFLFFEHIYSKEFFQPFFRTIMYLAAHFLESTFSHQPLTTCSLHSFYYGLRYKEYRLFLSIDLFENLYFLVPIVFIVFTLNCIININNFTYI
jgi:hypothetical protein